MVQPVALAPPRNRPAKGVEHPSFPTLASLARRLGLGWVRRLMPQGPLDMGLQLCLDLLCPWAVPWGLCLFMCQPLMECLPCARAAVRPGGSSRALRPVR